MGRISASRLIKHIPDEEGHYPTQSTLYAWINTNEWNERGNELDQKVMNTLDATLIQEKVEMLHRHTQVAEKMQSLAVDAIEKHLIEERDPEWLTASSAIRLLTEGIRIERESRGIPGMLEKISKRSDEDLLEDIKKLTEKAVQENRKNAEAIDGEYL